MKPKELRKLSKEELKKRLEELRAGILKERSNLGGGNVPENPGRIKKMKKDVARILTILNERKNIKKG